MKPLLNHESFPFLNHRLIRRVKSFSTQQLMSAKSTLMTFAPTKSGFIATAGCKVCNNLSTTDAVRNTIESWQHSDLRIEKGCTKIINNFWKLPTLRCTKKKGSNYLFNEMQPRPFPFPKTFPRKPSNSSKISSNPSKVTIGFFIALGAAVHNIHQEAFIWTLMHPIMLCLWHLGRRGSFETSREFLQPCDIGHTIRQKFKDEGYLINAIRQEVICQGHFLLSGWLLFHLGVLLVNLLPAFEFDGSLSSPKSGQILKSFSIRNNQSKVETKFPIPTRPTDSDEFTGARIIP